ncbi:MAG TPA: DUF1330 domain-containing protein [Gemmatimonadales bacterium]|nr:DUF1330 domain-containing protein [Gemmatimonadales bacterium]
MAYLVASIDVLDPERYEEYKRTASASIAAHGGKYLVRGGRVVVLEGQWQPKRFVVVEFPTVQKAKDWWDSADYLGPKRIRQSCAETDMIIVDGVADMA